MKSWWLEVSEKFWVRTAQVASTGIADEGRDQKAVECDRKHLSLAIYTAKGNHVVIGRRRIASRTRG